MILHSVLLGSLLPLMLTYSFADYKAEFNKTYPSQLESIHEAAFNASMDYIESMNALNLSYRLGPTRWSDQALDQIRGKLPITQRL